MTIPAMALFTLLSLMVGVLLPTTHSLPVSSAPLLDRIHTSEGDGQWFLDSYGRVRIFHGVNAVGKAFPWYRDFLLNDTRLDDLQRWGLNVVRLGSMWAGAEPARGQYNLTYINTLQTIVKKLSDRGIYTMLDMHQDCLTSKYQAYDGVPRWLVDTYPKPTNPFPWPFVSIGAWEEKYLTQAVSEAFQHFYNNVSSSIDLWATFWGVMAKTFRGNPAVLGYNLINEPWIGDFFKNITLAFPGMAGSTNLQPAYDAINEKIRQHDEEGIVFYEPVFYGQVGHGKWLGSGFTQVPGGPIYRNVSAYSFHMYCWALEFMAPDAPDEERREASDFCYKQFLPQIMSSSERNVQLTGGSRMLTEFGLCKTGDSKQINVECKFFLDLCDENLVSWIEWDYNDDTWYTDGHPVMDKVTPHVRPYARAVAGIPTLMRFNDTSGHFRLEYNITSSIAEPTEIVLPELVYPDDISVDLQGSLRYERREKNLLLIYNNGANDTDSVVVELFPKN